VDFRRGGRSLGGPGTGPRSKRPVLAYIIIAVPGLPLPAPSAALAWLLRSMKTLAPFVASRSVPGNRNVFYGSRLLLVLTFFSCVGLLLSSTSSSNLWRSSHKNGTDRIPLTHSPAHRCSIDGDEPSSFDVAPNGSVTAAGEQVKVESWRDG
jgi:hypothetical protein